MAQGRVRQLLGGCGARHRQGDGQDGHLHPAVLQGGTGAGLTLTLTLTLTLQIFEAVGLAKEVVDKCFSGTASRIGG